MTLRKRTTFVGLLLVSTAVAAFCCDPWGLPVQQVFLQVGQSISAVLHGSAAAIGRYQVQLATDFDGGVSKTAEEIQKQTSEQRSMIDGMLTVQQQFITQGQVAEAVDQAKPAAQQDTTVTDAALYADMEPQVTDKVVSYDANWSNQYLSTAPQDIGHEVIARHQPYCSAGDVDRGICKQAAIPSLQNADLTINSIYQPGNGQYDTLSDQEHAAALAFVQTVTHPVAYSPPSKSTDGGSTELDAQLASDQATLALVAHSFNEQIAERTRRHQ